MVKSSHYQLSVASRAVLSVSTLLITIACCNSAWGQAGTVKSFAKIAANDQDFPGLPSSFSLFGLSLTCLGDLDGAGLSAKAIATGAPFDTASVGAVWVIFLDSQGNMISTERITNPDGAQDDRFGQGVASIGDLDGDQVPELAVGAIADDDGGFTRGAVWILFLNTDGTVKSGQTQKISATKGGFPTGQLDDNDQFGVDITSLGDLDGIGPAVGAIAVGAFLDDDGGVGANANHGAVWILFLNSDGTVESHQKISETEGGFSGDLDDLDKFGLGLESLGDLDGNGPSVHAIAVSADNDDDGGMDRGAVWILFLDSGGMVLSHQKISSLDGGFSGSLNDEDHFGESMANLGDLDGSGPSVLTLAVGAPSDDDAGISAGAYWLLFLDSDGTVIDHLKVTEGQGGFLGDLDPVDNFAEGLGSLGDLDGDGVVDLAVGAPRDDDGGANRGAVWVLFLDGDQLLPPAVGDALADAGIDPTGVPPEILDALITADEQGVLEVIASDTTANQNFVLEPNASIVLGSGADANGNIEGSPDNTVVVGSNANVDGNIIGVGQLFIGGENVVINGSFFDSANELVVGPGAQVDFTGDVLVGTITIGDGGSVSINGDLDFITDFIMGPNASLFVNGNLSCAQGGTASIDPTATINVNGNILCTAIP